MSFTVSMVFIYFVYIIKDINFSRIYIGQTSTAEKLILIMTLVTALNASLLAIIKFLNSYLDDEKNKVVKKITSFEEAAMEAFKSYKDYQSSLKK